MFSSLNSRGGCGRSLVVAACLAFLPVLAQAEGTRTLHPTGATGHRGVMDVGNGSFFANVARSRQFLYVYAQAGEIILLGSRNRSNGGDIHVYNPQSFGTPGNETIPGTINFSCSSQSGGTIASRAQELAGPNSADGSGTVANGYTPCWHVAPTTGTYGVRFTGATSGGASNTASIATPPVLQENLIAAWDVTVRDSASSLADINGRLFTYAWTVYLNANSRRLYNDLYYVSTDGYRYRQTFRGLDPNRAAFYANARGFIDTNGGPLYRDLRGSNAAVTTGPSFTAGITAQQPQYPIFFSDVAPGGPNATEVNRVLTALAIPLVPAVPQLSSPTFVGNVGGNTSTVSAGGVFSFTTLNTLTYEIVVSRDGLNFDPANVLNRALTGTALSGNHSVLWNGLDNNGNAFPAGNYLFRIAGRNGEIHFPMLDVEGNTSGGPTLTKLNGSQDTTVYFDDRGYQAANGNLIGALNAHLCGATSLIAQPVPNHSLVGVDSANANLGGSGNYYRSWSGSNDANTDCSNSASEYFGTAKGLDLWALEKSQQFDVPVVIVEPTLGVDVGTMVSVTSSVLVGDSAFGNFAFTNAGDATATGVTYAATLGNPAQPNTCPAAVSFTLQPAGVAATFNPAPACTITFTGVPTTLTPGQSLNFSFNYVVAVTNPGPIPVTTTIAATNETPGAPAPNTAAAQTTVAKPVISVVKSSTPAAGTAVNIGNTITYTLSVTIANAPLTAMLDLDDLLGAGLNFGSVASAHGSFTCSGSLGCTLPVNTAIGTYTVSYTATVDNTAVSSVANNVTATGGGGDTPPSCAPCSVQHPLAAPAYAFCPAAGNPALTFNVVNGVNIYAYTPGTATPDVLLPLAPATMSGNLNALMVDPIRNRLLMIQRPTTGNQSTLWAYDAANGGWYIAAGPLTSPDFPRGGFDAAGTGYLLSGGANPEVWRVDAQPGFAYTMTSLGTMSYNIAPTDAGSGDLAFDGDGNAWLAVGQDLYILDLGTLVATRQTRPLLGGLPSTTNWAGIAFASDGTLVLANNNSPSAYYQYDPATGSIVHRVNTTANSARDLASCAFPAQLVPELSVVKTLSLVNGAPPGALVHPGDVLRYAITISNTGGAVATLYPGDIIETLPANTSVVAAGNDFTCTGSNCTNASAVNLPAGTTVTLYFVVQLDTPLPTSQISNAVAIPGEVDCALAANDCTEVTPVGPRVTMAKTLQSGGPLAQPGGNLTYAITLTNLSGVPGSIVAGAIGETVPLNTAHAGGDNFTCAGATAGSACSNTSAVNVPANGSVVLTFAVTVNDPIAAGALLIANTATPPTGVSCPNCTVTTPTAPNVTLVKALTNESGTQPGVAEPGETLTYTITLTNSGGTSFTNYDFVENVPNGATLANVTGTGVTACATPVVGAGSCNVTVASVPANASTTVSIVFNIADPIPTGTTSITNLVNGGDTTCPVAGNTCTVTTPTAPSVTLVKALTNESGTQPGVAEPGETLTYTITLTNSGGTAFTNYEFVENVPNGATMASVTGTGVTACATPVVGAGSCNVTVASVPANGSTTVTIVFNIADPIPTGTTSITNLVSGGDTTCPQSGNVCSVTTPTPGRIAIAKSVVDANANGIAEPGETLTWTITLSNSGGSTVTAFAVTDPLDPNTTFISADNSGSHNGVNPGGVVNWASLSVPAQVGATPGTLVLSLATSVNTPVPQGTLSIGNLAHETGVAPPDCNLTPAPVNCASIPTAANVTVSKALSAESINADGIAEAGEQLTYTITVRNHGGTPATNTIVNEQVPLHTTFVSGTPGWTCATGSPAGTACDAIVTVPAAGAGGIPGVMTLTFTVEVVDPIPAGVLRIANAVALDDGTPPDCTASPTHAQCVVTPTINLALVKSVESVTATGPGTYWVAYRIDLANTGGSAVTYTLIDTPDFTPNGVVITGNGQAATTTGTLNPALAGGQFGVANAVPVQISATGLVLAVGASHSYTVRIPIAVMAASLGNATCTGAPGNGLYNRASVAGSFVLDSATCAPVSGEQALIRLVKTVRLGVDANGDNYGNVGDVLHYGFAISNPGSVTLSAIDLIDPRVTDLQCDATTAYGEPMRVLRGDELFFDAFEHLLGGQLVPGDSIMCHATHALDPQDVLNRRVVNTATTSGAGSGGQVVTSTSTAIYTNIR